MTECFELIDRKLLKGPWVMGEQYTICDPRMAAGYSAEEKAKLLSARRTQNHGSILYSAFSTKSFSALPVAAVGSGSAYRAEPKVRIHLPPAGSQANFGIALIAPLGPPPVFAVDLVKLPAAGQVIPAVRGLPAILAADVAGLFPVECFA